MFSDWVRPQLILNYSDTLAENNYDLVCDASGDIPLCDQQFGFVDPGHAWSDIFLLNDYDHILPNGPPSHHECL